MQTIFKDKKKLIYLVPLPAISIIYLLFVVFGKGNKQDPKMIQGLNTELPKASLPPKQSILDKLTSYERAREDSNHRKQEQQRDVLSLAPPIATGRDSLPYKDDKSSQLLAQLNQLQHALEQPAPVHHPITEPDPQLERLNSMLDKVLRIQHPTLQTTPPPPVNPKDEVTPADSTTNTIAVSIPEKQVLTAGVTIGLRLEDDVHIGKTIVPRGGLVYGTVSINNDRMLVHVTAIRSERNIYPTDLTAYDLDGLAGIHIPGQLSRDVAKQSADQGLSGLNLMTYDPSLGAQAANAGIQTAKSLFSRKVRQVRITVPAGYQLLLRNPGNNHSTEFPGAKPGVLLPRPPGFVPGGPILKKCTAEAMELGLLDICLKDDVLWFALFTHNSSAITYIPEYIRWFIRDRRVLRRTAVQEVALTPVYTSSAAAVASDSSVVSWTGFRPFALTRDKELVIEMGEKGGGRILQLVLRAKDWKTIKKCDDETEEK